MALSGCAMSNKEWESWEDEIIRCNYGKISYKEMEPLLPGRTNQSIQHRRRKLGIQTNSPKLIAVEKWDEQDDIFLITSYNSGMSVRELSRYFGKTDQSIIARAKRLTKLGRMNYIVRPNSVWTPEEDALLREVYYDNDIYSLMSLLPGKEADEIRNRAKKRLGLTDDKRKLNRTYDINFNYFSELTVQNCYWAGFIAADGCLTEKKHLLSFGIKNTDGYLLEQFVKDCGFTGEVVYSTTSEGYHKANLYIWGVEQWFKDLYRHFNLTPRKSLTLGSPNLKEDTHIRAFIRGYIDGDGWILPDNPPNKWVLGVVGTEKMLWWICNYFLLLCHKIRARPHPYKNVWVFSTSDSFSLTVLSQLIKVDTPYLTRKWDPVYDYFGHNNSPSSSL